MEYCAECERYFQNANALRQHLENSSRHMNVFTFSSGSATVPTPIAPVSASSPTSSGLDFGMAPGLFGTAPGLFGTWPPDRANRTATTSGTAEDADDAIDTSNILIDSLKGLYTSAEYSDLVISCRGREYQVHKAIVCTQSDFFSAACRGSFKEAQEGKIDLPDDDPHIVHIMVHYLYHFGYDAEMDGYETDANESPRGALLTHAKVYALAEKYLIHGLKAVALRQFKAAAAHSPDITDFLPAMEEVYTSTMEDDRGLRDVVVKTLCKHSAWLDEEDVQDVVQRLGDLTYDVVIHLRQKGVF